MKYWIYPMVFSFALGLAWYFSGVVGFAVMEKSGPGQGSFFGAITGVGLFVGVILLSIIAEHFLGNKNILKTWSNQK